jgi:hypothetical protein
VAALHPLNSFGHHWAMGAAVGTLLVGLVLGPRLLPSLVGGSSPGGQSRFRRLLGHARKPVIVVLACWLGLMGWSALSPGGPMPPPKTDPSSIRVVTWNILHSKEGALPGDSSPCPTGPGGKTPCEPPSATPGPTSCACRKRSRNR